MLVAVEDGPDRVILLIGVGLAVFSAVLLVLTREVHGPLGDGHGHPGGGLYHQYHQRVLNRGLERVKVLRFGVLALADNGEALFGLAGGAAAAQGRGWGTGHASGCRENVCNTARKRDRAKTALEIPAFQIVALARAEIGQGVEMCGAFGILLRQPDLVTA